MTQRPGFGWRASSLEWRTETDGFLVLKMWTKGDFINRGADYCKWFCEWKKKRHSIVCHPCNALSFFLMWVTEDLAALNFFHGGFPKPKRSCSMGHMTFHFVHCVLCILSWHFPVKRRREKTGTHVPILFSCAFSSWCLDVREVFPPQPEFYWGSSQHFNLLIHSGIIFVSCGAAGPEGRRVLWPIHHSNGFRWRSRCGGEGKKRKRGHVQTQFQQRLGLFSF